MKMKGYNAMDERYECSRCTMSYHVVEEYPTVGERLRCPDCKMRFHSAKGAGAGVTRVCVLNEDVDVFKYQGLYAHG